MILKVGMTDIHLINASITKEEAGGEANGSCLAIENVLEHINGHVISAMVSVSEVLSASKPLDGSGAALLYLVGRVCRRG